MSKEINYVYKIRNLVNGKFYIGKHSTNDIDDNYFGSGIALMDAFKKYGKDNFKKEIIQFCDTEEGAYSLEAELLTIDVVNDIACYNMVVGGFGGGWIDGMKHTKESRSRMSIAKKGCKASKNAILSRSKLIVQKDSQTGYVIKTFRSASEASRLTGICRGNISNCARGERLLAGGYSWAYID